MFEDDVTMTQPMRPIAAGARVALFDSPGFPTVDAPAIASTTLDAALMGLAVERAATATGLSQLLEANATRVLVLSHGSAFPLLAWPAIARFLRRGGSLAALGGAPFH